MLSALPAIADSARTSSIDRLVPISDIEIRQMLIMLSSGLD